MASIVIGTAGHIDHGKSALVRALTGTDPDRLKEEQARGITIDLGFAHLVEGETTVAFVDVPGHERFVRNMLAGAAGIDAVLLVVAADESVMPQTREHFHICRLLGVSRGIVALTKTDAADGELQALAALEVQELAAGSFLEKAPVLRVSARSGAGLPALRTALVDLASAGSRVTLGRAARLPIDRVFTMRGFGTVVTGTLAMGRMAPEDELVLLPSGRRVRVRGLQVHGRPAAGAAAGQRVAVNLAGIEVGEIERGETLAAPDSLEPTTRADVSLELVPGAPALRHGARVRIHQGTSEALGRVALAGRSDQPAPGELTAGAAGYARLRLETPLVLTRADRFIVRSYSPLTTIGGGVVLDPQPRRGGVRTDAGGERLQRLDLSAPEADLVRELLRERGPQGVSRGLLVSRAGLSPAAATTWIETLVADGSAVEAGPVIVSTEWAGFLGEMVVAAVDRHHRDAPLEEGLPREEARARIFARMPPHLFDIVLSRLVEQGMVEGRDRLWRAGRAVGVSDEDARGLEALEQAVRDAGFEALDQKAAIEVSGLGGERGEGLLRLLLHRGRVVRLGTLLFHRDMLDRVVADVRAVRGTGETSVDVGSFKARYGLSRKYAMPLLEYLDRERITRRVGDRRLIL